MAGQLQRIRIRGFKSFRELDFELRSLNVLIGANGSGKSNFVMAFRLLNEIVEGRLNEFSLRSGGADDLLYLGRKTTDAIVMELTFEPFGYRVRLVPSAQETLVFAEEAIGLPVHPGVLTWTPLPRAGRESDLRSYAVMGDRRALANNVLSALESWRVYHFHDTSDSARVKLLHNVEDDAMLRWDAANLAAFLYRMSRSPEQRPYYERIVKTIQLVAPFFADFVLQPNAVGDIQLRWRQKGNDVDFYPNMLSDGTLRFICLTTLLLQPNLPSVILIDEPELGLHPHAITLLASMLRSTAQQRQVIVSTQSASLVDTFAPQDIAVVERQRDESTLRRLDAELLEVWLAEYDLGNLWEHSIIGGNPQRHG